MKEIRIADDSGLLSIVDVGAYRTFISENWTYEQIIRHFGQQMTTRSLLVWECGDGGGSYSLEIRRGFTDEHGFREIEGSITASGDALNIVSYDALTMAAQYEDEKLPSRHEADAVIKVDPGPYRVRLVQRFDPARSTDTSGPDYLIELEPGDGPVRPKVAWLRT